MSWLPSDSVFNLGDVWDSALHIFKASRVGICVGNEFESGL